MRSDDLTTSQCAFAAFGGIFFGFDSGYINGVLVSTVPDIVQHS